ncbi:MAG: DUF6046 domain-containing protein [Dysgonamonadaceae bacterium]|jgi:hypothetical protein|nr:DUF6046 domain-containing protein [Dysgonamonadaceae bacterium]
MVNYKFVFSSAGFLVKQAVYPLAGIESNTPNDKGNWATEDLKIPVVPMGVSGRFYSLPVILQSADTSEYVELPEAVVSITKSKKIVTTDIVGGNGTVKEFISDNDIEINIFVGIVSVDDAGNIIDKYPAEGVKALCSILDRREAIRITSDFLELFDIDGGYFHAVITDYSITQQTHSNRQEVTIKALSDYDYTIGYEEI